MLTVVDCGPCYLDMMINAEPFGRAAETWGAKDSMMIEQPTTPNGSNCPTVKPMAAMARHIKALTALQASTDDLSWLTSPQLTEVHFQQLLVQIFSSDTQVRRKTGRRPVTLKVRQGGGGRFE